MPVPDPKNRMFFGYKVVFGYVSHLTMYPLYNFNVSVDDSGQTTEKLVFAGNKGQYNRDGHWYKESNTQFEPLLQDSDGKVHYFPDLKLAKSFVQFLVESTEFPKGLKPTLPTIYREYDEMTPVEKLQALSELKTKFKYRYPTGMFPETISYEELSELYTRSYRNEIVNRATGLGLNNADKKPDRYILRYLNRHRNTTPTREEPQHQAEVIPDDELTEKFNLTRKVAV